MLCIVSHRSTNVCKSSSHFSQADSTWWWWFTPLCLGELNDSMRAKNEKKAPDCKVHPIWYCIYIFCGGFIFFFHLEQEDISLEIVIQRKETGWFQDQLISSFSRIENMQTVKWWLRKDSSAIGSCASFWLWHWACCIVTRCQLNMTRTSRVLALDSFRVGL